MLKKSYEKYKIRHDQHIIEKSFRVGDIVWFQVNKEILQGFGKKIKVLWYGPFDIFEDMGYNAYGLNIHPYMCIFIVMNVYFHSIFKLYDPFMLDKEEE